MSSYKTGHARSHHYWESLPGTTTGNSWNSFIQGTIYDTHTETPCRHSHQLVCFHHYHPHHTDLFPPCVIPSFVMSVCEHYTDIFRLSSKRAFVSDVPHQPCDHHMSTVPYQQHDQHFDLPTKLPSTTPNTPNLPYQPCGQQISIVPYQQQVQHFDQLIEPTYTLPYQPCV